MSSNLDDIFEMSTITVKDRTEELKQSLILWRHILLPLNNLLEWKHKYDPLIIIGSLTLIFSFIHLINLPVLTFISCLILIIVLTDLFAPFGIEINNENENWSSMNDEKYSRLCEYIAYFEEFIQQKYQSVLKIRRERPIMYLIIGGIFLSFIALCTQRIHNLLLIYLIMLCLCLAPGVCYHLYYSKFLTSKIN